MNADGLTERSAPETITLTAGEAERGERLDVFAARGSSDTRARIQKRIEAGDVLINGAVGKANARLKEGDVVTVRLRPPEPIGLAAEDIPLSIVYEDDDIAVVDKPKGMVVHPAAGNESGTLVNAAMFRLGGLSGIGGELRPGIVHRLDKLTSGLIVIAKNDEAHRSLAAQMKAHCAGRMYIALVDGNLRDDAGVIGAPIGRHRVDRKRMAIVHDGSGRSAVTHWRVIERYGAYTFIGVQLETGRTHQIRVHMASIQHPVSGDAVYGASKNRLALDGQALHAARLALDHPRTGERMVFTSPAAPYFIAALRRAGCEDVRDVERSIENCFQMMRHG